MATARPPISAGRLGRRITILQRTSVQDDAGQPVESWPALFTRWAWIKAPSGMAAAEGLAANRDTSTVTYSVRVRYCTDISAGMRVLHGADLFDIQQVIIDRAGRQYTDLVCTVGAVG